MEAYLTKTRFIASLQCDLRLWNQIYDPSPLNNSKLGSHQLEGIRIGELARKLFPNGKLIDHKNNNHLESCDKTRQLMFSNEPVIFEAAFSTEHYRTRVDIFEKANGFSWNLYEVKASTSIHDQHIMDLAYQLDVLNCLGIIIAAAYIIHVDPNYKLKNSEIVAGEFFKVVDLTDIVKSKLPNIAQLRQQKLSVAQQQVAPNINPGNFCKSPKPCEFRERCLSKLPKDWIGKIPRIKQTQLDNFYSHGITSISQIPDDMILKGMNEQIKISHKKGKPYITIDLESRLHGFGPPAYHLDFESIMPGIPIYEDTSPYQHIPFMFSLHLVENNNLSHRDFIGDPSKDPRQDLALNLIKMTAGNNYPLVVYSQYEKRIISELARDFPDMSRPLLEIISRLRDLYQVVQKCIYFPDFYGSYSIKYVGPALVPALNYNDLEIRNGGMAAAVYQELAENSNVDKVELVQRLNDIRKYCHRDTLATVEIWKYLITSI